MAQLLLGTVGAVVGSFIPGVGTALGWAIGSAIGGLIDPPKGPTVEGPRLSDLKTQTADYGVILPVIYGTCRLAGNVLWADEIKETKNKKKENGKGGPETTTITYVYTCSFAVGLCEGVIEGVRRIWANGELVYSATESSNAGTITESDKSQGNFRVYQGTEDQLPDPTIQASRGVGNTPTYRGVAYIVFTDLMLEKFGNRMPQLQFEVVKSGQTVEYRELYNSYTPDVMPVEKWNENLLDPSGFSNLRGFFGPRFVSSNGSFFRMSSPVELEPRDVDAIHVGSLDYVKTSPKKVWDINVGVENGQPIQVVESTQEIDDMPGPFQTFAKKENDVIYDMGSVCRFGFNGLAKTYLDIFIPRTPPPLNVLDMKLSTPGRLMWGGTYKGPTSVGGKDSYARSYVDISQLFRLGEDKDQYYMGASGSGDNNKVIIFSGPNPFNFNDETVKYANRFHILEIVNGRPSLTLSGDLDQPRNIKSLGGFGLTLSSGEALDYQQGCLDTDGLTFWSAEVGRVRRFKIIDGVLTLMNFSVIEDGPDGQIPSSADYPMITAVDGIAVFLTHQTLEDGINWFHDSVFVATRNPYITKTSVPLSSIVADQLNRVGYKPEEYNVTELNDLVDGFFLANRPTARTAIETLTGPYFFEAVESGEVLKFVKRGQMPTLLLDAEVLGATSGDPIERPDALTVTRQQELSQPLEISCQYQDRDADYRIALQYTRRQLTQAVNQVTIQLPLVLSSDKAKQVVDSLLFNLWTEREKFEFTTDRRFMHLEPTDVVFLRSLSGNVWVARIVNRKEGGDGTIQWEALAEDVSVYDPESIGITVKPTSGDQVQTNNVPTYQLAFNAPVLTGNVNTPGWFIASTGYTAGWSGSIATRSLDGGTTFTTLDSSVVDRSESSTMGFCLNTLGGFESENILDTVNFIILQTVGDGELSSVSYEQILAGANTFYVGGEILQAQDVEMLDVKTYKLTKLRRGRFGTERFINSHASNERWALLTTDDTQFIPDELGNIGVTQLVRGVTLGSQNPSASPSASFTFDGSTVKPLAPVQAYGITQPNGSIVFKWVRRARLDATWLDNVDVPLDEPEEVYEIDIATDSNFSNIVRTEIVNTQTFTYTQAMRTLDTGSTSGDLWGKVYQMSSRVGRGFPTTFKIV